MKFGPEESFPLVIYSQAQAEKFACRFHMSFPRSFSLILWTLDSACPGATSILYLLMRPTALV